MYHLKTKIRRVKENLIEMNQVVELTCCLAFYCGDRNGNDLMHDCDQAVIRHFKDLPRTGSTQCL